MTYCLVEVIADPTASKVAMFAKLLVIGNSVVLGLVVVMRFVTELATMAFMAIMIAALFVRPDARFVRVFVTSSMVFAVLITTVLVHVVFVLVVVLFVFALLVRVIVELLFLVVFILMVHVVEPSRFLTLFVALEVAELVSFGPMRTFRVLVVVVAHVRVPSTVAGCLLVVAFQVILAIFAGVAFVEAMLVLVTAVTRRALCKVMAGLFKRATRLRVMLRMRLLVFVMSVRRSVIILKKITKERMT